MADYSDATGSPQPQSKASHGQNQSTPSAKQPRNRKPNQTHSISQLDGTVSDSVANSSVPPRSRKQPKQKHNGSNEAHPTAHGSVGTADAPHQRPASVGAGYAPATPLKEQAYAGPTFQASPAPSSLPVPRFFAKSASVPNAAVPSPGHRRLQSQSALSEQSSPESDAVTPVPPRGVTNSPLDMFFNADKAERERSKSSGHMLSPDLTAVRPRLLMTEPTNSSQQPNRNVFLQELDGNGPDMPSPSTSSRQAPRPGLIARAQSSPNVSEQPGIEQERNEAYTKSLKELVFNSVNASANPSPPPEQNHTHSNQSPSYGSPSPSKHLPPGPFTPTPVSHAEKNGVHVPLYGSRRNLSPLFKAARDDTPSRPSNLRQELHNDQEFGARAIGNQQSPMPWHSRAVDPNSFSRQYLEQHIAAGQHTPMPFFPCANDNSRGGIDPGARSDNGAGYGAPTHHWYPLPPQQHIPQQKQQQPTLPSPSASGMPNPSDAPKERDLSAMSDDLRRMLNLNILG